MSSVWGSGSNGGPPRERRPISPLMEAALGKGQLLAKSILRDALEDREAGSLNPRQLGELARGVVAANSDTITAAMVDTVRQVLPPGVVDVLLTGLRREIRSGATGSDIVCGVLSAEITGMSRPSVLGITETEPIVALGRAHKTCLSVLADAVDPPLAAGVRDRFGLITTGSEALLAATPEILGTLKAAFDGAGTPEAEAIRRCAALRATMGTVAAYGAATVYVMENLAGLEGPEPLGPSL